MACVVYCPNKAIEYKVPEAYVELDTIITRRMCLPEDRKRYHIREYLLFYSSE